MTDRNWIDPDDSHYDRFDYDTRPCYVCEGRGWVRVLPCQPVFTERKPCWLCSSPSPLHVGGGLE